MEAAERLLWYQFLLMLKMRTSRSKRGWRLQNRRDCHQHYVGEEVEVQEVEVKVVVSAAASVVKVLVEEVFVAKRRRAA